VRHGISDGMVCHAAWYPTRHGIPCGMASHTAWYPIRQGITYGVACTHAGTTHRRLTVPYVGVGLVPSSSTCLQSSTTLFVTSSTSAMHVVSLCSLRCKSCYPQAYDNGYSGHIPCERKPVRKHLWLHVP
jgi:hypothetical protein